MNITVFPTKLSGLVTVPPSKSVAHRMVIAAALSEGTSTITNIYPSEDILATMSCMRKLGAEIDFTGDRAEITGIKDIPETAELDCGESGSTLRFLIPVACALGVKTTFQGRGRLPQRPITPYLYEFPKHGISFEYDNTMPFSVNGKLTGGKFYVDGGISSQFITGLLFALPLLKEDSEIVLTSHLESKPYVDITLDTLRDHGCKIEETENGYFVKGGQHYEPFSGKVEGDYSQAAFFKAANSLGSRIEIAGLEEKSFQGDKKIVEICEKIVYNKNGSLQPFDLDCSDIPDLVPILTVLGCFCEGKSYIRNAARLRIKECDRLSAISQCLNKIGGRVKELDDGLEIEGVLALNGGTVESFNDHRIAMSMAVAATRCTSPLKIKGAECVRKSYPDFFGVYESIGGEISRES
ncbi:3-phosphoshikimate 1-carboxyvinyltransferase [uncultured Ruminococcus sp.]|uniref:3-phosphoshikimate 1-carboxyvinyltransferase n=1 Tax=uncultured Ruminococcus sp. TaxID=165186 RepID=UPI0025F927C9|nr:3-phosphoshikimate 1-carboxyvinyltransferase [uncultured Ruminococcus sp.]